MGMCESAWDRMGMCESAWDRMGMCESAWDRTGMCESAWDRTGMCESAWDRMGMCESAWGKGRAGHRLGLPSALEVGALATICHLSSATLNAHTHGVPNASRQLHPNHSLWSPQMTNWLPRMADLPHARSPQH
eukprot:351819-Chlamydomonas_euryale.AAC.6